MHLLTTLVPKVGKMVVTEADYNNILDYLHLGNYLKVFTKNEGRTLHCKTERFRVKTGVLNNAGRRSAAGSLRRVVKNEEEKKILHVCHSSIEGTVM